MSLLGSIGGALTGGIKGFLTTGSLAGGAIGAVGGGLSNAQYKSAAAMGHGRGLQLAAQAGSYGATSGQYSASPSARLAAMPGMQMLAPSMGGGGATGTFGRNGKLRYSHYVVDPNTGRTYRVSDRTGKIIKPRQMNPLNGRAARRAIRRVKGARKMLQAIERSLPRARARHTPTRSK
jgi:hypothetical protein